MGKSRSRVSGHTGSKKNGNESPAPAVKYMRVRRMPAKKRYQVMTRLARQRAREAGQEEILVETLETRRTRRRRADSEPLRSTHTETTWGPFDEYDNEMTTLRHPKRRSPLMPAPPQAEEEDQLNLTQAKASITMPIVTAKKSGCDKYHPYLPEDSSSGLAKCFLRPKPTPVVDGQEIALHSLRSVKASNRLASDGDLEITPSLTARHRDKRSRVVSRLGTDAKLQSRKKPGLPDFASPQEMPERRVLRERNIAY